MKNKLLPLLLVALTMPAFADHRPGHDDDVEMMGKEKKIDQLVTDLGLSEEQSKKVQASREKYKTQITDKESAYNLARDQFHVTVKNPNATSADLQSAYKKKEDAQRALQDVLFESRMEFREILTAEQRSKLISKGEKSREKLKNWKEKRKDRKEPDAAAPGNVPAPAPVPAK